MVMRGRTDGTENSGLSDRASDLYSQDMGFGLSLKCLTNLTNV